MVKFDIYYPTRLAPGSTIDDASQAFPIDGPDKEAYRGYKMIVDVPGQTFGNGLFSEYYGVSGTDWVDPRSSTTRTRRGRSTAAATTCSSTTATGCGWWDSRRKTPPTGSTTRCFSRSTRASALGRDLDAELRRLAIIWRSRPVSANAEKPAIGVVGVGWVGPVTAACFAGSITG